jgi:hypothetical protein
MRGITIHKVDRKSKTVGVTFDFGETDRVQNLANFYVRWVPQVQELKALLGTLQPLQPELEVRWPTLLDQFWSQWNPTLAITTAGVTLSSSDYVSLGVEAPLDLNIVTVVPTVVIQIADNPRAFWSVAPKLSAHWLVRPHDFLAIMLVITRFCELQVTANNDLLAETQAEYPDVPPISPHRQKI